MKKSIDYIGVGVGAVIVNARNRVFLAKRGAGARNERFKWEFPGGGVEFGELLRDAVAREVREEYDFEIEVGQLLDVVDHLLPEEKQHWVSPTFLCTYKTGEPRIMEPQKCEEIGWFDLDKLPEAHMTSASLQSLASLRKRSQS